MLTRCFYFYFIIIGTDDDDDDDNRSTKVVFVVGRRTFSPPPFLLYYYLRSNRPVQQRTHAHASRTMLPLNFFFLLPFSPSPSLLLSYISFFPSPAATSPSPPLSPRLTPPPLLATTLAAALPRCPRRPRFFFHSSRLKQNYIIYTCTDGRTSNDVGDEKTVGIKIRKKKNTKIQIKPVPLCGSRRAEGINPARRRLSVAFSFFFSLSRPSVRPYPT